MAIRGKPGAAQDARGECDMPTIRSFRSFFAAAALLSAGGLAQAGTLGLNPAPFGSHSDPAVQFALWDLFSETQVGETTSYTFNGIADGSSTLTTLNLAQNSAHGTAASIGSGAQGAGLLATGDVANDIYYSSTFAQNWTLNATASIDISAISFQIKTSKTAATPDATLSQYYIPTLNGTTAGTFFSATPTDESAMGTNYYVIEYRWANLDIDAGTPLALTFSMAGGSGTGNFFTRKPVDFVALDVTSVPEPGSLVLCGLGALVWPMLRRRARR